MMNGVIMMKDNLKRITPAPVWAVMSKSYWSWRNRGRHVAARWFNPDWMKSRAQLAAYRNRYEGQRCFIIGNGPSLRNTDLALLKGEHTFGLNRIYLMFSELKFTTSFLVSVNDLVLEQCAGDMQGLALPKFVTWRSRKWIKKDENTIFVDTDFTGEENFSGDAAGRLFEGFTVTFVALQLAFHMGFSEAVLVGVDHNFTTKGPANATVISQGDDPNHFSGAYFGKGFRWQLPDLDGSERAYRLAREAYAQAGRRVVDATVGGKLTVFPKVEFRSLFG
jgi:hypothetical protein